MIVCVFECSTRGITASTNQIQGRYRQIVWMEEVKFVALTNHTQLICFKIIFIWVSKFLLLFCLKTNEELLLLRKWIWHTKCEKWKRRKNWIFRFTFALMFHYDLDVWHADFITLLRFKIHDCATVLCWFCIVWRARPVKPLQNSRVILVVRLT